MLPQHNRMRIFYLCWVGCWAAHIFETDPLFVFEVDWYFAQGVSVTTALPASFPAHFSLTWDLYTLKKTRWTRARFTDTKHLISSTFKSKIWVSCGENPHTVSYFIFIPVAGKRFEFEMYIKQRTMRVNVSKLKSWQHIGFYSLRSLSMATIALQRFQVWNFTHPFWKALVSVIFCWSSYRGTNWHPLWQKQGATASGCP